MPRDLQSDYVNVLPNFPIKDLSAYKVESLLGGGGFAHVVLARDPAGAEWALKLIPSPNAASLAEVEACSPMLLTEARIHLLLSHEPSVLPCLEAFKSEYVNPGDRSRTCMAVLRMPVAACSVEEWLFSSQPPPAVCQAAGMQFDEAEVLGVWLQMVNAVYRCHLHGVTHKDIKLPNFLMDHRGKVMVMDFGLASLEGVTPRTVAGTPWTMSPAGFKAGDDGRAGDWWSLGVVLYQLLQGGAWPFKQCWWPWQKGGGERMDSAIRKAVLAGRITFRNSHISEGSKALIRGLLQPDPNRRWQLRQVLACDAISAQMITRVAERFPELGEDMRELLGLQQRSRGIQALGSDGGAPAAGTGLGAALGFGSGQVRAPAAAAAATAAAVGGAAVAVGGAAVAAVSAVGHAAGEVLHSLVPHWPAAHRGDDNYTPLLAHGEAEANGVTAGAQWAAGATGSGRLGPGQGGAGQAGGPLLSPRTPVWANGAQGQGAQGGGQHPEPAGAGASPWSASSAVAPGAGGALRHTNVLINLGEDSPGQAPGAAGQRSPHHAGLVHASTTGSLADVASGGAPPPGELAKRSRAQHLDSHGQLHSGSLNRDSLVGSESGPLALASPVAQVLRGVHHSPGEARTGSHTLRGSRTSLHELFGPGGGANLLTSLHHAEQGQGGEPGGRQGPGSGPLGDAVAVQMRALGQRVRRLSHQAPHSNPLRGASGTGAGFVGQLPLSPQQQQPAGGAPWGRPARAASQGLLGSAADMLHLRRGPSGSGAAAACSAAEQLVVQAGWVPPPPEAFAASAVAAGGPCGRGGSPGPGRSGSGGGQQLLAKAKGFFLGCLKHRPGAVRYEAYDSLQGA